MKYTVSVDKALTRGKWLCNVLPILCLLMPFAASFYLLAITKSGWFVAAGFLVGLVLSFICWGFTVVYWKIWAYSNVRNLHELKKRAITDKIIHRDGSFSNRFEIINATQRQTLAALERRFSQPDLYSNDTGVPPATYIYISAYKIYEKIGIAAILLGASPYIYFYSENVKHKPVAYFTLPLGLLFIYQAIKMYRNKKPQLILDEEGIRIPDKGLMQWRGIYNDNIITENKEPVLTFFYQGNSIEIEIENLRIKEKELRHLIHVYKARHENTVPADNN